MLFDSTYHIMQLVILFLHTQLNFNLSFFRVVVDIIICIKKYLANFSSLVFI
jgi:hypothetical protein